jgi:hypothetical protein
MVGENFEIYLSQMCKYVFTLSTMVGENFENYLSQFYKYALTLSTMFGEDFEIYLSQLSKYVPNIIHHGWRKFCNSLVSNG